MDNAGQPERLPDALPTACPLLPTAAPVHRAKVTTTIWIYPTPKPSGNPFPASSPSRSKRRVRARRRARIEAHGDSCSSVEESADRPEGGQSGSAVELAPGICPVCSSGLSGAYRQTGQTGHGKSGRTGRTGRTIRTKPGRVIRDFERDHLAIVRLTPGTPETPLRHVFAGAACHQA